MDLHCSKKLLVTHKEFSVMFKSMDSAVSLGLNTGCATYYLSNLYMSSAVHGG